MPTTWFIVPYKRGSTRSGRPSRYCEMDDFTSAIMGDGGFWYEVEVLGNQSVEKVDASNGTINSFPNRFKRLPVDNLSDSLSGIPRNQDAALRNLLKDAGYTEQEVKDRFGLDFIGFTLGDVLRFMASRRQVATYNLGTDTITCNGNIMTCGSIDELDGRTA